MDGVLGKGELEGDGGCGEGTGEPLEGNGSEDVSSFLIFGAGGAFDGTFLVSTVRRSAFDWGSGGGEESEESESWSSKWKTALRSPWKDLWRGRFGRDVNAPGPLSLEKVGLAERVRLCFGRSLRGGRS